MAGSSHSWLRVKWQRPWQSSWARFVRSGRNHVETELPTSPWAWNSAGARSPSGLGDLRWLRRCQRITVEGCLLKQLAITSMLYSYIHHPGGKIRIYASQHCVCETKPDSECLGCNAILCVYLSTIWQFHLLCYSSGQYELHQTHQLDRQTRCGVAESSARFGDLRLNDPFPELRRRETSTVRTNVSASQAQCQNWDALIIRRYIVIIIITYYIQSSHV